MDLNEMIDAIVRQRVEATLAELLTPSNDRPGVASKVSDYAKVKLDRSAAARETYLRESGQVDPSDNGDTPKHRRRSRGRNPRLGYVVVPRRGRPVQPELFSTADQVWKAIVKSVAKTGEPISAVDIEKLTGLGKKTVESCVYYLRRHDPAGALVADGKGLITAEPLAKG